MAVMRIMPLMFLSWQFEDVKDKNEKLLCV